jgi:polyphosphate kinase 2
MGGAPLRESARKTGPALAVRAARPFCPPFPAVTIWYSPVHSSSLAVAPNAMTRFDISHTSKSSLPKTKQVGESIELTKKAYIKELNRLQIELVKLQEHIIEDGLKVVVLFEGRDGAGKGGTIKRITETLNPRVVRVVALSKPTEKELTQWYFQRYVAHLPSAGEMVLFDRSWYNRAGVERVMGFCTDAEYTEFMRTTPQFERALIRSGIVLIKYWFSVSAEEQERRFRSRIQNPTKRWKLSGMDLTARTHWVDYARAKDEMFAYTDIKQSPWFVIDADNKKAARLNCISHLLSMIPYDEPEHQPIELPSLQDDKYVRTPEDEQNFVPRKFV